MEDPTTNTQPDTNAQAQPQNPTQPVDAPTQSLYTAVPITPEKPKKRKGLIITVAIIVVLLITLAASFVAIQLLKGQSTSTTSPQQYSDPSGFKITPPKGWKTISCSGNSVCFRSASGDPASKGFYDVIAVASTKLSQPDSSDTLSLIVNASIDTLSKSEDNFKVVSTKSETVQNTPATLVTFTSTDNGVDVTTESLFVISNGIAYSLNGLSTTASWPQNESLIQTSLLSFIP